jgi:hypothetical protein
MEVMNSLLYYLLCTEDLHEPIQDNGINIIQSSVSDVAHVKFNEYNKMTLVVNQENDTYVEQYTIDITMENPPYLNKKIGYHKNIRSFQIENSFEEIEFSKISDEILRVYRIVNGIESRDDYDENENFSKDENPSDSEDENLDDFLSIYHDTKKSTNGCPFF